MGVQDVKVGMKVAVVLENNNNPQKEFIGEVTACENNNVIVALEGDNNILISKKEACQLRIIVDNVLYKWDDIEIIKEKEDGTYNLYIESNPQVFNRRKYPRMPLANACSVRMKNDKDSYNGRMVNISANGFAFSTKELLFVKNKGKDIIVDVKDFDILDGKALQGSIIRSSNNDGEYIIGCRMPEDSAVIKEYVSQNYSE